MASLPDVCPPPAGPSGEGVDYVEFARDDGSIGRMALVRVTRTPVPPRLARYEIGPSIAAGGMARVHLGRLVGAAGFAPTVAIKRIHEELSERTDVLERFIDEGRIASRVRHANVVPTLDAVQQDGELLIVMEYLHGESLGRLRKTAAEVGERIPAAIASAIVVGALRGLHAAHEALGEDGTRLEIVHRDVSPQNMLVGIDGIARVCDFGIAKAVGRLHETFTQDIKGKLSYMAPEQISGEGVDRRCDLFAAGVILWELLAGERLFRGDDALATMDAIFHKVPGALEGSGPGLDGAVDAMLARALAKDPSLRFATADEMARAIEDTLPPASPRAVAEWVERIGGATMRERSRIVADFERGTEASRSSATTVAAPSVAVLAASRRSEPDDPVTARRNAVRPPASGGFAEAASSTSTLALGTARPSMMAVPRAIDTDLPMVTPLPGEDPPSDHTRVAPIEQHARARHRTPLPPIPMPTLPPAPPPRTSFVRAAILVLVPPAVAAMAILGVHLRESSPAPVATAAAPPELAEPAPPVLPEAPPTAAPALTAAVAAPAPSASASVAPRPWTPPRVPGRQGWRAPRRR